MEEDTFTQLPLHIDPQTKAISCPSMQTPSIASELSALNISHKALLSLDGSNAVPPQPLPLNPKRSAAIQKMREQGNACLQRRQSGPGQQQNVQEAIKLYTYAIEMALTRPTWEPASIVRDELAILMSNRSQCYIALQAWPEGAIDAQTSVEMKAAPGQGKAWWRRGRCLLEMGRLQEAKEWVEKGLDVEGGDGHMELKSLLSDVEARLKKKG